jgi:hypothetical protein
MARSLFQLHTQPANLDLGAFFHKGALLYTVPCFAGYAYLGCNHRNFPEAGYHARNIPSKAPKLPVLAVTNRLEKCNRQFRRSLACESARADSTPF